MIYYQLTFILFLSCLHINPGFAENTNDEKQNKLSIKKSNNEKGALSANRFLDSLTVNFDITSNYIFRGLSFSSNLPALQGGLTYLFPSTGLYANVWGSNVKFYDSVGNVPKVEIDAGGGIKNKIGKHFSYDLSWVRYTFPKGYRTNYGEYLANFQYYFITTLITYTNSYFGTGQKGNYTSIGVNYDIPSPIFFNLKGINFSAGIGYFSLPDINGSYADYRVQLSKTIKNYKLSVQWTDTNHQYNIAPAYYNSKISATFLVSF